MSYCLTVSLPGARGREPGRSSSPPRSTRLAGVLYFLDSFVSLEHILDVALENQKIWRILAVDLQRAAIVPLNCSLNLLAIKEHNDHQSVSVNLLFIVEDFRT